MKIIQKRLFSIIVLAIFLILVGWSGYQVYRIGVGIEKEIRSLSSLIWEVENIKLNREYSLKVMIGGKNPSAEPVEVIRLEVVVFLIKNNETKIYIGGNYRLFEPDPLILKPHSNSLVQFKVHSEGLKIYQVEKGEYFYVEIFVMVNTEHIKNVKLKYSYEIPIETI